MATATVKGISRSNIGAELYAYDLVPEKAEALKEYGVLPCKTVEELAGQAEYLVLVVKPQNISEVLEEARPFVSPRTVFVSIAAGITSGYICKKLGFQAKVVRVMPNTPLMLSYGATAISKKETVSEEEFAFSKSLFDCAGITAVIEEDKMNEIIPINGSSPAFIYQFAAEFIKYGKSAGIDEAVCLRLFAQTLIGSAKMLTDSGYTVEELITMVSSKGGTTIAGLAALDENGFASAIDICCKHCVNRAYELTME